MIFSKPAPTRERDNGGGYPPVFKPTPAPGRDAAEAPWHKVRDPGIRSLPDVDFSIFCSGPAPMDVANVGLITFANDRPACLGGQIRLTA